MLRNTAISILRLAGWTNITPTLTCSHNVSVP